MAMGLEGRQIVVFALAVAACCFDMRTRRVPNALTLGGAVLALGYAAVRGGPVDVAAAALGWCVGLALFLPFFVLGGLGAGDVKLLACLGAWLGPESALWLALYAAMAGGVMGLIVALATGYLKQAVANVSLLFLFWQTEGIKPLPTLTLGDARGPRLPYALPIAAGVLTLYFLPC